MLKSRGCATIAWALLLLASMCPAAQASGITNSSDDLRTGWYGSESAISPGLVSGGTFGQEWSSPVEGQVYAQPLLAGSTLLVATEQNKVYGLDPSTGEKRWTTTLTGTPWSAAEVSCGDLAPSIGVTATPVIDTASGVAYMTHKAYASGASGPVRWYMDAIELSSGHEKAGFPVQLSGAAQNDPSQTFQAKTQLQRPGLLLMEGVVYAAFGSDCDVPPYQGWIFGVTESGATLARWTTETAGSGSGIWQSGAGLTSDGPGTILFSTGNGSTPTPPTLGSQPPGTLGESVVRVRVQPDGELEASDFFAPFDASTLAGWDADFASGGVTGLPQPYFGTGSVPHLAVAVGKDGYVYLLNRDNLGGIGEGPGGSDKVQQRIGPYGGVWSRPGVWPGEGGWVYIPTASNGTSASGSSGNLRVYRYGVSGSGAPTLALAGTSSDAFGFSSGAPVITSNGTAPGSALVWTEWAPNAGGAGAQLRAYDPVPVEGRPALRWSAPIGTSSKFATPGVGAGRLYVGTRDGHVLAFGAPVKAPLSGPPTTFGPTTLGTHTEATLTLTANEKLTVEQLVSSSAEFQLGTPSRPLPAAMEAGEKIAVPITFAPSAAGPRAATVTATAATAGGTKTVPFSVSGTGQAMGPKLEAAPTVLSFGGTSAGGSLAGTVTFRNVGSAALTVQGVESPAAPFHVEGLPKVGNQIPAGQALTIPASFEPTEIGSFSGQVALHTTGGNVAVALTGSAAPPGKLVVAPEAVDFGNVQLGTQATRSFTVSNAGGIGITLFKSKPPVGGAFTATSALSEDTTIAPGETLTETVQFTPSALGPTSGFWLLNGEGSSTVHEVLFSGVGVPVSTGLITPMGGQGILSFTHLHLGALLAAAHLTSSRTGTVPVTVRCPGQPDGCSGMITLRTRGAVRTSAHQLRAAVLTMATGPFRLDAGHTATFRLRLSSRARALLARQKMLRIAVTIASQQAPGRPIVTSSPATLRAALPAHHR